MKRQSKDFSKREKDVVELLLQGKGNKQIALALGITESTVEFHLKNIYAKLEVNTRAGAILKLGKSVGHTTKNLGETIVEKEAEINHTSGTFILWKQWMLLIKETVTTLKQEIEMKNRLLSYVLAGLVFGASFLFYFEVIDRFMNTLRINEKNPFQIWAFISLEFLLIFGIWLIPTVYPARYEFRHSKKISLSAIAVAVMWVSAVLGYYLTYSVLLAWISPPHMEPGLVISKFLQWAVVGVMIGGLAGLVTSWMYSFWIKRANTILPE